MNNHNFQCRDPPSQGDGEVRSPEVIQIDEIRSNDRLVAGILDPKVHCFP